MQIKGEIAKLPIVKEKVIFSAIKENNDKPIQLVLFKNSRPATLTDILSNANLGDVVTINGRLENNPQNKEIQIIIDDIELDTIAEQEVYLKAPDVF